MPFALCSMLYANLREAEIGKLKSNWELQGLLGVAAFVLGFLVADNSLSLSGAFCH